MPCSICRQAGHNRSTCPRSRGVAPISGRDLATPPPGPRPLQAPLQVDFIHNGPPPLQRTIVDLADRLDVQGSTNVRRGSHSMRRARKKWQKAFSSIQNIQRFLTVIEATDVCDLFHLLDPTIIYYPSWLRAKTTLGRLTPLMRSELFPSYMSIAQDILRIENKCLIFHNERNPERNPEQDASVKDALRIVKLVNLRSENYLVYWVLGNYMVEDIDRRENSIRYMGLMLRKSTFDLKTMNGHRFYLVPHKFTSNPPYHPEKDSEFYIDPYCQVNIHDKIDTNIYIDEKDDLSELNKWKFNALKLDYLIKEVIKLGGKNNDILESVLDLHEDIKMDECSEWLKDIAGVPSTFTNIT